MRHARNTLLVVIGGMAICATGRAEIAQTTENPYQAIIERNVFGLKPPPPPPPPPEAAKPPAPKFILTGITTLLGTKQAFMKAAPTGPAKPGEQLRDQFYTLAEGQRDGELEVVQINEREGTVSIKYDGNVSTLDFTNNGAKITAMAPMPGVMNNVPAPAMAPGTMPGAIPQPQGGSFPAPSLPGGLPGRTLRMTPPGGAAGTPNQTGSGAQFNYGYAQGTPAGQMQQVPMPLGVAPSQNPNPQAHQFQNSMSLEQQYLIVEAERERTRQQVTTGRLPPLPPTPFTPPGSPGSVQQAPQQDVTAPVQQRYPPPMPGMPLRP